MSRRACCVIWDFDGTLVDSREKNLNVTRAIVEKFRGRSWRTFPALESLLSYVDAHRTVPNWRVFYEQALGMSEAEIDEVGYWWSEFQLDDKTVPETIEGIPETIKALSQFPSGIVSQNARSNIYSILKAHQLADAFRSIVGYEEVGIQDQKPSPKGLLKCIDVLTGFEPGTVFFIGDHVTDAICARRTQEVLIEKNLDVTVRSIRAAYAPAEFSVWETEADFVADAPGEVTSIVLENV